MREGAGGVAQGGAAGAGRLEREGYTGLDGHVCGGVPRPVALWWWRALGLRWALLPGGGALRWHAPPWPLPAGG